MKKLFAMILLMVMLSPAYSGDEALRLTIYNRGIMQVAQVQKFELKKGENWIIFDDISPKIISETMSLTPAGKKMSVTTGEYLSDIANLDKIWNKFVGQTLPPTVFGEDTISGKVLHYDEDYLYIRMADGGLKLVDPNDLQGMLFTDPPEGLIFKPYAQFQVANGGSAGKSSFELNYLTSGVQWGAYYNAVYVDGKLRLSGDFIVENELNIGFDGAELALVAGEAHMAYDRIDLPRNADMLTEPAAGVDSEPLLAYYIYPIAARVDLPAAGTKVIPLMENKSFNAEERYIMKEGFGLRNLDLVVAFTPPKTPLPEGEISVYRKVKGGKAVFIGEDKMYNTPPGREAEITIGKDFNLQGERRRISHKRQNRNVTEDLVRVKLMNGSDQSKQVIVRERVYGVWEITSAAYEGKPVEYTEISSRRIEFKVKVKEGSSANLEYTVRYEY